MSIAWWHRFSTPTGRIQSRSRIRDCGACPVSGPVLSSVPAARSGRSRRRRGRRGPVRVHGHSGVSGIMLEQATVESNLYAQLQGSCTLGRNMGFQPGPHANIAQVENTDTNRENDRNGHRSGERSAQMAIRRTVNRILLIKWTLRRAGDGNRTRTISLGSCGHIPADPFDLAAVTRRYDVSVPLHSLFG